MMFKDVARRSTWSQRNDKYTMRIWLGERAEASGTFYIDDENTQG